MPLSTGGAGLRRTRYEGMVGCPIQIMPFTDHPTFQALTARQWHWLTVTLLIRADEFCIDQHVSLHCSLDLRFCRAF